MHTIPRDPRLNYPRSMVVVLVRPEYLNIYTPDLYKFGISLKRSYISIRRCKENANTCIFI